MKLTGKNRSIRGKTCPSATLSTTNPTWTDLGSNPGLRGGRPLILLLFTCTYLYKNISICGSSIHAHGLIWNYCAHFNFSLYLVYGTNNVRKYCGFLRGKIRSPVEGT
jgi:hypothetical protein